LIGWLPFLLGYVEIRLRGKSRGKNRSGGTLAGLVSPSLYGRTVVRAPRLDPATVREVASALEEEIARLDARSARCALCRDAEAVAFLRRMPAWLERAEMAKPPPS